VSATAAPETGISVRINRWLSVLGKNLRGPMRVASDDNTIARTLHDLGLASWFGGSLMGAAGLNGAASVVDDPTQRLRVANSGWARWTPLNLAGIVAHLAGGAVLTGANKGRLAGQHAQDRPDGGCPRHDRLRPCAWQEAGTRRRRPGGRRHHPKPGDP
jgi:hypothetical protein